jgi:hypothetical protein
MRSAPQVARTVSRRRAAKVRVKFNEVSQTNGYGFAVIPAQAGIQNSAHNVDSRLRGNDANFAASAHYAMKAQLDRTLQIAENGLKKRTQYIVTCCLHKCCVKGQVGFSAAWMPFLGRELAGLGMRFGGFWHDSSGI